MWGPLARVSHHRVGVSSGSLISVASFVKITVDIRSSQPRQVRGLVLRLSLTREYVRPCWPRHYSC